MQNATQSLGSLKDRSQPWSWKVSKKHSIGVDGPWVKIQLEGRFCKVVKGWLKGTRGNPCWLYSWSGRAPGQADITTTVASPVEHGNKKDKRMASK